MTRRRRPASRSALLVAYLLCALVPGRARPGLPAGARAKDVVDVRAFGAKGDGKTDDTAAMQAALDAGAGRTVVVPRGTYLVLADGHRDGGRGGLVPRSGTRLVLAPDAVLKAKPTRSSDYIVVRLEGVSHVVIKGGTIQGDRDTHLGRDGEWGFGVGIFGASDVLLEDLTVRDCWGDGVFIEEGQPGFSVMPRRITLRRVRATNNRRQGLSILGVEGLTVVDSIFERTAGTPPSAGVDIEPDGAGHRVSNVTFRNCIFRNNAGCGFVASATTGDDVAGLRVLGGTAAGNGWEGIMFNNTTGGGLVSGVAVRGNGASGVFLRNAARVTIAGNVIEANSQRADATFFGIHVQRSNGVTLRDNLIRAGDAPRKQRYGIALEGSEDVSASGNDLRRSGCKGDLADDRPTRSAVVSNRLTRVRDIPSGCR
jgi:hypothetical protein